MEVRRAAILIVEDELEMRELLTEFLEQRYECASAASAEQARKIIETREFDLILVDVGLPGESGLDLCRAIKGTHPDISAIVMSGSPDLRLPMEACRSGAVQYLEKPFGIDQLSRAVENALRHQKMLRELNPKARAAAPNA